jgi:hemerythrin-like domain-containing protein
MERDRPMTQIPLVATAEHAFVENEHRELAAGLDHIHHVGTLVGSTPTRDLTYELLQLLSWIEKVLEPHALWEETVLYEKIDQLAGTGWATKLMRYEHQQIRLLVRRLERDRQTLLHETTHDELVELRGRLFALEGLIRAHLEREEVFLIPLLDQ